VDFFFGYNVLFLPWKGLRLGRIRSLKELVDRMMDRISLDKRVYVLDREVCVLDRKVCVLDRKVCVLDRKVCVLDRRVCIFQSRLQFEVGWSSEQHSPDLSFIPTTVNPRGVRTSSSSTHESCKAHQVQQLWLLDLSLISIRLRDTANWLKLSPGLCRQLGCSLYKVRLYVVIIFTVEPTHIHTFTHTNTHTTYNQYKSM